MSKFRNYSNYEIYPDGKIWSYKSKKFLKPATNKQGYQQVCIYDNEGNKKTYRLHRVVWEAVTGEHIPEGLQVNHINEVKTDNFFANLNLMTCKENINFGSRNERAGKAIANNTNRSKAISKANTNNPKLSKAMTNNPKLSKAVGAYKDGKLVMEFPSTNEAGRNGFNQGAVWACCRNCYMRPGNNVYRGYEWRYL